MLLIDNELLLVFRYVGDNNDLPPFLLFVFVGDVKFGTNGLMVGDVKLAEVCISKGNNSWKHTGKQIYDIIASYYNKNK